MYPVGLCLNFTEKKNQKKNLNSFTKVKTNDINDKKEILT